MMPVLIHLFHIFLISMLTLFVVSAFFALNGSFDHWTDRYNAKPRRRFRPRYAKKPYAE